MADEQPKQPNGKTRDRSPSFPFIPLKTAAERFEAFESYFGRHPAPTSKAGLAWGMKEKSSQANQTLAALRSFGFIRYKGSGTERQMEFTEEGRTYLRTQQESVKKQILKQGALRPKIIRKYWASWGADRPPDAVTLDQLYAAGFSDVGAANFLKVYDNTIAYAGLSNSDKMTPVDDNEGEGDLDPLPPLTPPERTALMEGERIVFTEESQPNQYVKLVASGEVDGYLLDAISDYVNRQKKRLKVMITPIHGALATEYTDDEEGREAEERDRKLNEKIDGDEKEQTPENDLLK